jgi:hypothetical protein
MTARTKSTLILFATLALGMVLGSLITGAAVNRRLERLAETRTARGMIFFFERAIQPESDAQREAIRTVLEDAAPAFTEVMRESRERMARLTDSLRAELEPLLTDAQKARLDEGMRMRRGGPPFGPGADRPPPPGDVPGRPHADGLDRPRDGRRRATPPAGDTSPSDSPSPNG